MSAPIYELLKRPDDCSSSSTPTCSRASSRTRSALAQGALDAMPELTDGDFLFARRSTSRRSTPDVLAEREGTVGSYVRSSRPARRPSSTPRSRTGFGPRRPSCAGAGSGSRFPPAAGRCLAGGAG
jgi:hypothetical protein